MKAIRGATTVDVDSKEQVEQRTVQLVEQIFKINKLAMENVVYIMFTQTADITSYYPATAVRLAGCNVPLFSAQEPKIIGSLEKCIRVMIVVNEPIEKVEHVYLQKASNLRKGNSKND